MWDLLMFPTSGVSSWFGRVAVLLWYWGPAPDTAYEPGSYGARSAVGKTYRIVWRTGQVIGWTLLAPLIATLLWRIYVH